MKKRNSPRSKNSRPRAGFTLVELLVAIGIFSIVVSIAAGGFVRALRSQAQIVALVAANSNASLAVEQIAREIRTGSGFNCTCGEDNGILTFTNSAGHAITYKFAQSGGHGTIERGEDSNPLRTLTADNVNVQYLVFRVAQGEGLVPRITLSLGVSPTEISVGSFITNIETTVSSRQL